MYRCIRPHINSRPALKGRLGGILAPMVLMFFVLLATGSLHAQFFPIYDEDSAYTSEGTHEAWIVWPLYSHESTTSTLTYAVHPLFSSFKDHETERREFDILWPIYNYRYRPETTGGAKNYRRAFLFPVYYDRKETRFNREISDRFLLPVYFSGKQGERGKYLIVFPIVWYGYNARLPMPLFPSREQTFGAIFPIAGDFRGYYNRDRIAFFLWPVFVYSSDDYGEDFNEKYSFIWPVFGIDKGPKVSGFRVWPLFGTVKKEGEFARTYWLWPLGHRRKGAISKTNEEQEDVTLFIPFYADFERPNIDFEMIFPFYGKLDVGSRSTRGYALAIYNTDTNTRLGVREDRYLWFLIRRKTYLPGYTAEVADPSATVGGGFFPFYVRTHNDRRVSKSIAWPFHQYRYNEYKHYTFERSYVLPFYSSQRRDFEDGDYVTAKFVFPFFRTRKTLANDKYSNALHLFFYTTALPMDRNYAPLWTFWEKSEDLDTGEKSVRVMKNLSKYERRADGSERRRANFLVFDYESIVDAEGVETGHTRFFFGLVGRHRDPELRTEFLWMKF